MWEEPKKKIHEVIKLTMQNSPSKFHNFSFQSSKFAFCHFSPLSFNSPQFSILLIFHPYLPLSCPKMMSFCPLFNISFLFNYLFLN